MNIQETHLKEDKINNFNNTYEAECIHDFSDTNHGKGVVTIIDKNTPVEIISTFKMNNGRAVLINIMKHEQEYTIVNIYAPTDLARKKQFFEDTTNFIRKKKTQTSNLIICGDINISPDSKNKKELEILEN